MANFQLERTLNSAHNVWRGTFTAMANACEVLIETKHKQLARKLTKVIASEAFRIEQKWSRYREDSIIQQINNAAGKAVKVDTETANMLDYAAKLYDLSEHKFDITSGVLRKIWRFSDPKRIPTPEQVNEILPLIGWDKCTWAAPIITLPQGMELDFGGIGKEYAVDKALNLATDLADIPILVNFGGDIAVNRPHSNSAPWLVGIHNVKHETIAISTGGLATSGDAYRFIQQGDTTYSHILDPTNGWSVTNAPKSVTVLAGNCTLAGMMSTLAMLQGAGASAFLQESKLEHFIQPSH